MNSQEVNLLIKDPLNAILFPSASSSIMNSIPLGRTIAALQVTPTGKSPTCIQDLVGGEKALMVFLRIAMRCCPIDTGIEKSSHASN